MGSFDEINNSTLTPIQQFYANSKIFITGGTGFMGTILVEKLLRSCPNIQTIYLLIRSKNGKSPDDRLLHYFDDDIFNTMKKENPNYKNQVVGVHGDILEPGLGLNENDRNTLIEEVNIVFHVAATVKFNEKFQKAVFTNVRSTRDVIALSKVMKNLKFITHVSTAYVHCEEKVLEEKFYKSPYKAKELITVTENSSSEVIEKLTGILMQNFPNTYTLTKTVAEELIENCNDLPIAVFRPAIIVSTLKEPVTGWVNNMYGPSWGTCARMMGLLRSSEIDASTGSNLVPVDMCTNTLITIPWQCRQKYDKSWQIYQIPIYNYETNSHQYLSWNSFLKITGDYIDMYPSVKMIRECFQFTTKSYYLHTIIVILLHYFPAIIIDAVAKCIGKESNLMKQYKMIDRASKTSSYFCNRHWNYKSNKMIELCDSMTQEDKKLFYCDLRKLNWDEYLKKYILGCRKYLLKEDISTIAHAKKRLYCIKFITRLILVVMFFFLVSICSKKLTNEAQLKTVVFVRNVAI